MRDPDETQFRQKLFSEALKFAEGGSQVADLLEADLDKDVKALNQALADLTLLRPLELKRLRLLLAGVVGKAKLVGALGPFSEAAKKAATEPYQQNSRKGGRNSGQTRREERATTWEPHAKDLAVECRFLHPKSSQDDVASYIGHEWKLAASLRQKHPTFKKLVVRMEREGILPRRAN